MKLHIKTLLLTAFFAFAALGVQAQEKYSYTILYSNSSTFGAYVFNGKETKTIEFTKDEIKGLGLYNLLLREVEKMEDHGWEMFDIQVYSSGTSAIVNYQYHFRKKRE